MPFLGIATLQPSSRICMCSPSLHISLNDKVLGCNFIHGTVERSASIWPALGNHKKQSFNMRTIERNRIRFVIKAVATLQPKCPAPSDDKRIEYEGLPLNISASVTPNISMKSPDEDEEKVDEREKLRRLRISKANKGNTPWNKGRKHSPETLRKIKERTRLAMQNPKVKMKLANLGHAQSKETRKKIGVGVQMGWRRRRQKQLVQESCLYSWQNLVAEAFRQGLVDEEEYQWDTYEKLNKQLEEEWLQSVERRRTMVRVKTSKRAPKSLDQRRKIAVAIAAKWADPSYRERVCSALAKYHGTTVGAERKRRRPSGDKQSSKSSSKRAVGGRNVYGLSLTKIKPKAPKKSKTPKYKDPLASAKLEMLRNIRAQRVASESKKNEALERAKLLIAKAEKAAKALEVAATRSPIAQASLIETRKLIAQAIQSIESAQGNETTSIEVNKFTAIEHDDGIEKEMGIMEENLNVALPKIKVNGVDASPESSESFKEQLDFRTVHSQDPLNGIKDEREAETRISGYGLSSRLDLNALTRKSDFRDVTHENIEPNGASSRLNRTPSSTQLNGVHMQATTEGKGGASSTTQPAASKRWVRGRLVEVVEGE